MGRAVTFIGAADMFHCSDMVRFGGSTNVFVMKIFINASEVASMIGRNKFKAPTEVIFRIWGRYFAEDLQQTIHSLKKQ